MRTLATLTAAAAIAAFSFAGTAASQTIVGDPTGDTANEEIDIESVELSKDANNFTCLFNIDTTAGLLKKSTFRCHIDFDDAEEEDEITGPDGVGCDAADGNTTIDDGVFYRLGGNNGSAAICTTSDITMTYRPSKRGGKCTGLPGITCTEEETDGEGDTDALCNGTVPSAGSTAAVSCTITLVGSLNSIADVRDAECDVNECLTNVVAGDYDVYMFFDSQRKSDRDRVLDTDNPVNSKPDETDEAVVFTLTDPTP